MNEKTRYLFVAKQRNKTYIFASEASSAKKVFVHLSELHNEHAPTSEMAEMQCMEALFEWSRHGKMPRVDSDTLRPFCRGLWKIYTDVNLTHLTTGRHKVLHVKMFDEE